MSFLSNIRRLYRNLVDALQIAHKICKLSVRLNNEIQASNASDGLKTASAAFVVASEDLCTAIEVYKDSLPGN